MARSNASQRDGYRIEIDRRLIPLASVVPLALCVSIVAKAADLATSSRFALSAAVGAVFVALSVALVTNRNGVADEARGRRSRRSAWEDVDALSDAELVQRAFAVFWGELDLDESVSPAVKAVLLKHLHEAADQLRAPGTAAEGRGRLRNFLLSLALRQTGHKRRTDKRLRDSVSGGDVNAGVEFEQRGDLVAAEAAYRRADTDNDVIGAVRLGALLEQTGDFAEAVAAYRRADLRGSAAGAARFGKLLESRGDLEGAEAAYRRADSRGSPSGAAALASVLARRGRLAEAEDAFSRFHDHAREWLAAGPTSPTAQGTAAAEVPVIDETRARETALVTVEWTFGRGEANVDELQRLLDEAVSELLEPDSESATRAEAHGVDPRALGASRVLVHETGAGTTTDTSIVISIATGVAPRVAAQLWENVLLPHVRRRLGAGALGESES